MVPEVGEGLLGAVMTHIDLGQYEKIGSIASAVIVAVSSLCALALFTYKTASAPKVKALDIVDIYHTDKDFHESLRRYKVALSRISLENLAKLGKVSITDAHITDEDAAYLSDIFYILTLYNYWCRLLRRRDVDRRTFRKYLAAIIADETMEAQAHIRVIDRTGTEFADIAWLQAWYGKIARFPASEGGQS